MLLPKLAPPGPIYRAGVFFPLSSLLSTDYSLTRRVCQNMFSPLLSTFYPLLSSPQGSSHSNSQNSSQNGTFGDIDLVPDQQTASNVTQNVPFERDTPVQNGTFWDIDPNYRLSSDRRGTVPLRGRSPSRQMPWRNRACKSPLSTRILQS